MVPKQGFFCLSSSFVLELCCFEWFQNSSAGKMVTPQVLELCCFEWFQNQSPHTILIDTVLELCCFEWFQNVFPILVILVAVLELCCFEWFQITLKATHLSSFFLIQVYILVVTIPFPCREARLQVLRTTLPLPVSD